MDFLKKNIKWVGLGGVVIGIISLFMPFATVSAEIFGTAFDYSISYIDGDGVFVLFAMIASGVLLFLNKDLIALICLGVGACISVYSSINVNDVITTTNANGLVNTKFDLGFYLLFIGFVVAIASILYNKFVLNKGVVSNNTNNISTM